MMEIDQTYLQIEEYRQRCLRGETISTEESKRIVAYLREKRGKAKPEAAKAKKAVSPGTSVGLSVDELLEGLQ